MCVYAGVLRSTHVLETRGQVEYPSLETTYLKKQRQGLGQSRLSILPRRLLGSACLHTPTLGLQTHTITLGFYCYFFINY